MRRISLVIGILATTLTSLAHATNLSSIYQSALQQDGLYQAAAAEFRAQQELLPQVRSALLPQVNLSASLTHDEAENPSASTLGDFSSDTENVTLSLSQSLYNHGVWAGVDQAKALVNQAEANFTAAQQDLIVRSASAYFDVLRAQDALTAAQAEKEAIGRQLQQTQKRYEVGLIAVTDVRESQASYDLAVAQEISAQNQLDNALEALQVISGQYTNDLSPLGEDTPLTPPEPADSKYWVDLAMKQNPTLLAARFGTESARAVLSQKRSGHYPSFDLSASHSDSSTSGDFEFDSTDTQVSVSMSLELFSGFRTSSEVDEAHARFEQAKAQITQAQRETTRQARASFFNVQTAISRVNALKQALISTQTAAEATQAGFEVGTRTAVDVLLNLRSTFSAERDYKSAQYDFILNMLRLKQAAGTLSEKDLQLVNQWLSS